MKNKVLTLFALATALGAGSALAATTNAPTITAPARIVAECTCCGIAPVVVTATVADVDGDALTAVWYINGVSYQTNDIPAVQGTNTVDLSITNRFSLGTNAVRIAVTDGITPTVEWTTEVIVQDTTPPDIRLTVNPKMLWPPNHKMVAVRVLPVIKDCSPTRCRIVQITSNEPDNGKGDGNTSPDWAFNPKWYSARSIPISLRAERSGRGDGRIYTIVVEAEDAYGNSATARTRVFVPHDMGKKSRMW